jgi:hypothetical protein
MSGPSTFGRERIVPFRSVAGYSATQAVRAPTALRLVKVIHTVVWALLALCVVSIPVAALARQYRLALMLTLIVLFEVAVLAANRMRCPLTDLAARYTNERSENFDIYLPLWLAQNNKRVFGALFVAGEAVLIWCWLR